MIRTSRVGRVSLFVRRYLFAFSAVSLLAALLINSGFSLLPVAHADASAQPIPFTQNWSNTGLITTDDNWNNVPGIIGYRGDDLTTTTGTDPQTILVDGTSTPVDVNANRSDPDTFTTGGVTEFDGIANPTVAMQGSGTADAPFLLISLNTTGKTNINIAYNLRDIDASTDNAQQQVALQFRIGSTGNFTNLPAGYVSDATTGGTATQVTPVSVTLPVSADNQSLVQVRIMTTNAVGNDEWVGVDDINITSGGTGTTNPSGVGSANPNPVAPGNSTLLTVTVTPGGNPPSTGITVTGNLTAIGGSATQQFFDDGLHEDGAAGDNVFAFRATIPANTTQGVKNLPVTINDAQARSASTSISLTVQSAAGLAIHDVQGNGTTSPFANQTVTVQGVVTALRFNTTNSALNGFFLQTPDANADADPNTSEGIFVFTSSAPPASVAVGNLLTVTGTVSEFIPSTDVNSPPETELTSPVISLVSTGNPLPAAITLTAADTSPSGSIEQLEKFEGMRVRVASLTASAPTQGTLSEANATSTSNGTFYGVITGLPRPFREPGIEVPDPVPTPSPSGTPAPNVPRFDANPERLRVDTDAQPGATALDVSTGAVVTNLVGPLDYVFRTYTILTDPTPAPGVSGGVGSAVPVPTPTASEFTVGSFNMQRFYNDVDDAGGDVVLTTAAYNKRLNKASLAIRNVMRTPDIIGIEEMENLTVLQAVASKVNGDAVANGDPNPMYQAFLSEGNDVGLIDVGFLVKTTRVNVVSVTQFGKETTYTNPNNGSQELLNDRPPLVLVATINKPAGGTEPITVIVNHLRSLNGVDDPADGNRIRTKRKIQAEFLANLIQARQTANPTEKIISVGDYNAFQFNDGYVDVIGTIKGTPTPPDQVVLASADLVNPNLVDLIETLPADQRYSFTFDGNAQTLDHELVNVPMLTLFNRIAYARNNGDYPDILRNDMNRPERLSDHDMPVSYFHFTGSGTGMPQKARADFDGDMKTDLSVIRPVGPSQPLRPSGIPFSRGMDWLILNSQSNSITTRSWGIFETDRAVPGDYDGDGRTDIAVFREAEGNWYIIQSMTGTARVDEIGVPGDIVVPADYDGDGKTDVGIWRPSTGGWVIRQSSQGGAFRPQVFWGSGELGDTPVPGDYDGDGKADIAVWRESEGNWYILNSLTNTVTIQNWGQSGDNLVPADYDGDGKTDVAVFRSSEGNWYIRNSGNSSVTVRNWGLGSDTLVPGDYDGDGKTDIAVWRGLEGNWYIINSLTNTVTVRNWGQDGDQPVPAAYVP